MAEVSVLNKLHGLVTKGRLEEIKELLSQDQDAVNAINMPSGTRGYTPMHKAVSGRRADILQVLLAYGGNVDALANGNYTPIHLAAYMGDVKCIEVLLEFGANLSISDKSGKTPHATAKVKKKWEAARVMMTYEIKKLAFHDIAELRTMLEGLQRGRDVEDSCFEDALEIAVHNNSSRAVGHLVLHGAKNLEKCMQKALLKSQLHSTAVLLLLCHASKINDREMVKHICIGLNREMQQEEATVSNVTLTRKYLPKEWNQTLKSKELRELRESVSYSDMAFPVAVAFGLDNFEVVWTFLSEVYCKRNEEADWHGLDLNCVLPEWIERIINYRKLILSHNLLDFFPRTITNMKLLTRLDLFRNSIQEVPKELFEMKHLQNLNLSSNRIQFLPKVDEWTKSLKRLNLEKNFLRFIDNSISESELEDLNLSDNKLSTVPSCVCEIKTLQVLDLSQNQKITVLPPDLAKLSQLDFLGIEKMDQITDPPPSLRAPTSVLLSYLRARLRNSEPYYTMKLMIVGLANRGKTTLMHRINRDFAFNRNTSTQGVDICEIKIDKYTFKCWDFAGQEEYYATYQCFLSQRSLYLLVWSVEDGDDGIAGLKPWLDNLQFRVPRSAVIIVGTHLDKVSPSARTESFEDNTIEKVYELVSNYKEIWCKKSMIMLVTSDVKEHPRECKKGFEKLRNLITAVADRSTVDGKRNGRKVMGEMVPSSYLTLATLVDEKRAELEKAGNIPLLRRCQFQDLINENATKHPRDYFDPEDIDVATEFLHNIGILLHYDDPNQDLRDLYFISPSWLCDLMAKIVSVKVAQNFIKDGVLFERDIPFIIDENQRFPKAFYPKYLRLLARFQIAVRVGNEILLVPSRLPSTRPGENLSSCEPPQTLTRIHTFSSIPVGFWSRFISRFLLYLNEMLNVNQQNIEGSSHNQRFDNDESEEDTDSDGSNSSRTNSPSEAVELGEDNTDATWCSETRDSTLQTIGHASEREIGFYGDTPHNSRVIHSVDATLIDSDTEYDREFVRVHARDLYVQHARTETGARYFDNEDVSSCNVPCSSDGNNSLREIASIAFGGSSSLSSSVSTCNQDNSNADNAFYFNDNSIIQTNWPSYESQNQEDMPLRRRAVIGSSCPFPQSGQHNSLADNAEQIFNSPVDLPYLLSHRYLVCWRKGILFKHPQLYLSVSLLPPEDGRDLLQTKVSCTGTGYRALAFIVDHIRTLMKEWFPGLDGTIGLNPYVSQLVPCPTCLSLGVNPPYHFNVADCFKESLTRDCMVCGNSHTPHVVALSEICPDLLFMDLDSSMQLKACDLRYYESDVSLLGSGQYGKVYIGEYNGKAAAIKIDNFKVEENPDYRKALDHFYEVRQEAVVLSRIRHHPNVISFYGVVRRPKLCIVTELATMGTLREVLETQTLKRVVVYRIAQQIASTVAHLHSLGIIHRDLKSANFLMFSLESDSEVNIKLADFRTANFVDPVGLKYVTGTPGFIAPEIFEYLYTEEYNEMVDVYSYAMVLYELISRRRPFQQVQNLFKINAMVKEGKRPAFYDLLDTKVRFLTLTELMVTCWAQEAIKRPKMSDVYNQTKSQSFCLLYGKVLLGNVSSPSQLCFLQGTNEVWIHCCVRTDASIFVVDLVTSEIKQKFVPENKALMEAKESFFSIVGIHDIDSQHIAITLRSKLDYVSIYSKNRKTLVDSYQVLEHYIRSLTVCEFSVVLDFNNGCCSIVSKKEFLKGRFGKIFATVSRRIVITSTVTERGSYGNNTAVVLGCDKYIYKYTFSSPDFEQVHPEMAPTSEKKMIYEMHTSEDGTMLFVSYLWSPVISTILIDGMRKIGGIDCSYEVKMLMPNSDANDQRVTTFCVSSDTLWVGTGSGHILLYEVKQNRTLGFITWLKPYKLEVRSLISCSIASADPSRFVVSIGKEVNLAALCYYRSGLCFLTSSFPVDPSDPAVKQRKCSREDGRRNDSVNGEVDGKEMLLTWDAPEAVMLKKLVHHETEEPVCNDTLDSKTMREGLDHGRDVELETAVLNNDKRAIGDLVLHGARSLEGYIQSALLDSNLLSTAVFLLLCHASKINDQEMVEHICVGLNTEVYQDETTVSNVALTRKYLPKEWNQTLTRKEFRKLREAVCPIDRTVLVAVACKWENIEIAWTFLSEMYCKRKEEEADWHGLALNCILPEWIERIINYKKLMLSHNLLDFFPPTITNMRLLTKLDLSRNSIEKFPKELFEMKQLQHLNLSSNRIQFLPKVDEWTKSLKILNLKENSLGVIDDSISQSELEDLNLSENELSLVPLGVCEIKTLQVLDLSHNQNITVLPPDLAKLSKLNYLGIEKMNQITDPPPSLREPTIVLLRHLRAKLRNSKPYYTMKLMIVGLANRGKTTLMHRINRHYNFNENNSTQGVNIHEIKIGKYTFKCWDFAGQEEYYATHQCFLSQRSLYLLVWSVEDGDDGIAGLKPWLDNLQFRVPRSAVIIVGTHLDKVSPSARTESFEDNTIEKVYELVSNYEEIICEKWMIMLVTCKNTPEHLKECKRRFDKLRNLIRVVAENITVDGKRNSQKVMGEMVPSSYLTLARMVDEKRAELEKAGNIPLLRHCQFQDLIIENSAKHPRDYIDPEDIDVATEFLHNIGIILHYDDSNQNLRDLYFISPSWLSDLLAKIITVKEAHSFIKDGVLFERDIEFIIGDCSRFPNAFYPKYLRLLAKFQIACRVDIDRILVPSRLPSTGPSENFTSYEPSQTLIRIHSFSCIPNGYWSRFISRFLMYLSEMLNANQGSLERGPHEQIFGSPVDLPYLLFHRYLVCWRNGILLKHPQLYLSVSLLPPEDGYELVRTKVSCTMMGYRALAFIVDHIRTLVKDWFPGLGGIDRHKNPYVSQFVPCPTCLTVGINPPYHFNVVECLRESMTRDYIICGNSHTPEVVKLSELCPDLLFMDLGSSMQLKTCDLRYDESNESLLGSGQYGKVYTGRYNGKAAAIKIYNFKLKEKPDYRELLDHFYEVRQEAVVLSRIRHHPNVISFYGVASRPKFCIVIELATKGTLREVLETQTLKRVVVYRIAQQIASAVAHLHSLGIIHRDLKSDNVLMFSLESDSEVNVKLADFGTANFVDPVGLKYFTGTPGFIAPEIKDSNTGEYDEVVDVYSFAMVLYELISKRRPFQQAQSSLEIDAMVKEGKRPAFYDLLDTKVRFLTLTELMVKCWVQEAGRRPKMKDVSHQLKSPSFYLLYGKVPLRNVNFSHQLSFLEATNEVWISCDDRTDAFVLVVDLVTSEIKQKLFPEYKTSVNGKNTFFNIVGIHDIDVQHVAIILRSKLDYVSIYSKDRKKLVDSYPVSDRYVHSLVACNDYVTVGFDDGCFSMVSKGDFLKGRLENSFVTVNKWSPISYIVTDKIGDEIDSNIILGCDRCIYKYPLRSSDFEQVHPAVKPTNEKKMICEMHVSEDGTMLFVSHAWSPVISTILIDSMTQIGEIDCSNEVKMLVPNSDMNDQRVTTFCVSNDTLWVGTGSGHILLYEVKRDRTLSLTRWLKPYEQEVQSLTSCKILSKDPSHFVVSIGNEVNVSALCYDRCRLCLLTSSFPADPCDPTFLKRKTNRSKDSCRFCNQNSEDNVKEMLLIWEAPETATLKKAV